MDLLNPVTNFNKLLSGINLTTDRSHNHRLRQMKAYELV
ncbi:hypothetical protein AVDCRST_MAG92-2358 [uncultured Coleofasciculus sp.]|uniref:Uncharacterized protein n=1 Tax=uncultured Coleofasciculus sp. TaxID=1267456 RepID=A0A6J4ISA9_9CYAN|nr:hypothetical protein AVDCRST_MAG92-2358 [uncultured Coleofasciculus sp.]